MEDMHASTRKRVEVWADTVLPTKIMKKTYIADLSQHVGQTVELRGWVYNKRSSGKIKFLLLRDGTGLCQCVYFKGECEEKSFEEFEKLTQEACVFVTGVVKEEKRSPGGYELSARTLTLYSPSVDYPIGPKEHGTDFLMGVRHLWLRSTQQHAALRVRAEIISAVRDFFNGRGFTLIDAPIFTPSACEGTTTLFETNYFDEKAFLSQSGQLYNEAAAAAFGKVYCFGPTFRAEKSKTRRHLIEFWMVEPEVAFNDLYDNMELAEQFVEYVVQRTIKNKAEELKVLERNTENLLKVKAPFKRLHYNEAAEIILKENPAFIKGDDFGGTDETIISSKFETPVFVHHYPQAIKAFYMKEDPAEPGSSMSCDLLATFSWFLDLRKYGSFPHAGFGLGIERTVSWICGLQHVRETIPFPRMYGRLRP